MLCKIKLHLIKKKILKLIQAIIFQSHRKKILIFLNDSIFLIFNLKLFMII